MVISATGCRVVPEPGQPWLNETKESLMLLWIAIIIAVLWLLGLLANIGGGLIHILLVVAVVVLIFHFLRGRSRA
ncbi:MAG: lmo0937 family membrane protein [Arthrobacter sp.]